MRLRYYGLIVILLMTIGGLLLATGCGEEVVTEIPGFAGQIIQEVTVEEAYTLIQQYQLDPTFIIIDVRTPEEFAEGHIEGAINKDFRSENFSGQIDELDRYNKYLIYCRSGNRSIGALEVMVAMGFREVYHLSAGIFEWIDEGYPIAFTSR